MFNDVYRGKRVLITGNTGFKGSWLALFLQKAGAEIHGYALPPEGMHNHFQLLNLQYNSTFADIKELDKLLQICREFRPEIIFHLAAQPIVFDSYREPVRTFADNVMGTVNILECARQTPSVRGVVAVTSDKCYDVKKSRPPFAEDAPLGGFDPYSASKACAEIAVASYRDSFGMNENKFFASVRAGNVIAGGDWGHDRLLPDLMRNAANRVTTHLRSPHAVRPWQHVLDALSGYMTLGMMMLENNPDAAQAWNFGPTEPPASVADLAGECARIWDKVKFDFAGAQEFHETQTLILDCTKARQLINWSPVWNRSRSIAHTVQWYRDFYSQNQINSQRDLDDYIADAESAGAIWMS